MKVTPRSSARWIVRMDSASSLPAPVYAADMPIVPRPMRDTSRSRSLLCFTSFSLSLFPERAEW